MSYREGLSALTCATDGTVLTAATPEALEVLWQGHGGRLLETGAAERTNPGEPEAQTRGFEAIALIHQLGQRCTCASDDIRDCPNYVPGDEEEDHDD